ncbi:hypothetical protein V6N13_080653 [Hibiscus sabdariffa]|uniref:Uncharacterized protein n=1 Tax=Hibiscus sabdariffa TaxID=183260 RepID=A0ABR2BFA0_9ROSI
MLSSVSPFGGVMEFVAEEVFIYMPFGSPDQSPESCGYVLSFEFVESDTGGGVAAATAAENVRLSLFCALQSVV